MEYLFEHDGMKFRRVDLHDVNDLTDLKNESWLTTHKVSLVNRTIQIEWINNLNKQHIHFPSNLVLVGVHELPDSFPVGIFKILNIDWISRKAEVGWDIYKEYRGKGLGKKIVKAGTEFCFTILNLRRLECQILRTNIPSIACTEKAGFKREGIQENAIFKFGVYIDNYLYGLTK